MRTLAYSLARPSGRGSGAHFPHFLLSFYCFCYTCAAAFLINSFPPSQTAPFFFSGTGWDGKSCWCLCWCMLLLFTLAAAHPPPLPAPLLHRTHPPSLVLHLFQLKAASEQSNDNNNSSNSSSASRRRQSTLEEIFLYFEKHTKIFSFPHNRRLIWFIHSLIHSNDGCYSSRWMLIGWWFKRSYDNRRRWHHKHLATSSSTTIISPLSQLYPPRARQITPMSWIMLTSSVAVACYYMTTATRTNCSTPSKPILRGTCHSYWISKYFIL